MDWNKWLLIAGLWIGTGICSPFVSAQSFKTTPFFQDLAFLEQEDPDAVSLTLYEDRLYQPYASKSWFEQALLWRPFVRMEFEDWVVDFNPAYVIFASSEDPNGGITVNARGVQIRAERNESFGFVTSVYENQVDLINYPQSSISTQKVYPGLGRVKDRQPIDAPYFQGEWYWKLSSKVKLVSGFGKIHSNQQFFAPVWSRNVSGAFYASIQTQGIRLKTRTYWIQRLSQNRETTSTLSEAAYYTSGALLSFADYALSDKGTWKISTEALLPAGRERPFMQPIQPLVWAGLTFTQGNWYCFGRKEVTASGWHAGSWFNWKKKVLLKLELIQNKLNERTVVHLQDWANPYRGDRLAFSEQTVMLKRWNVRLQEMYSKEGFNFGLECGWTLNPSNWSELFVSFNNYGYFVELDHDQTEFRFGMRTHLMPQNWR